MIQRIQSILLFLVFLIGVSLYFFPIGTFTDNLKVDGNTAASVSYYAFSTQITLVNSKILLSKEFNNFLILIVAVIFTIFPLVIVFLYKNRLLQIKLVKLNLLINFLFLIIVFWYVGVLEESSKLKLNYSFEIYLVVLSIILLILSNIFIKKDEEKVRAADRLRPN